MSNLTSKPTACKAGVQRILISQLTLDCQTRAALSPETVRQYADDMRQEVVFDPPTVFSDGRKFWPADGYHRIEAKKRTGQKSIDCEVRQGTRKDAIEFGLGANVRHGLRRNNADKQRAADIAVFEFPAKSDRQLAEMCAVHHNLIADARKRQVAKLATCPSEKPSKMAVSSLPPKRIGKDGKAYPLPAKMPPPSRPTPPKVLDGTQIEVPPASLALWNRMNEVQELLTAISKVRGALRKAQAEKDRLFVEVDFNGTLAQLNQAFVDLQRAKPFAVCHSCNGKVPNGCPTCGGRGFVSEFFWKHAVPLEVQTMRGAK